MTQYDATLDFTIALVYGLLLGSFVEYTGHRFMHKGKFLGKRHAKHHRNFGIGISIWDRTLGTFKASNWQPEHQLRKYPISEFLTIRWR